MGTLGQGADGQAALPRYIAANIALSIAWSLICIWMNAAYLAPRLPRFGFSVDLQPPMLVLALTLSAVTGALLPRQVKTASGLAAVLMAIMVIIPTQAIVLTLSGNAWAHVSLVLSATAGILAALTLIRKEAPERPAPPGMLAMFSVGLLFSWLVATVILLLVYRDDIRLVDLGGMYEKRLATRAETPFLAYLRTYYVNVICPGLIAYGMLQRRRILFLGCGLAGLVLIYAIAAQKTAFLIPLAMISVALGIRLKLMKPAILMAMLVLISALALLDVHLTGPRSVFAGLFLHRIIGTPALALAQYGDYFAEHGYTLWTHVRGIGLFIAAPQELAAHPKWPELGYLIGDGVLNQPHVNNNAHFLASDGAAAAGVPGVLVISGIFCLWLLVLDRCSRDWSRTYVMLVSLPVILSLLNGPFFTVMLSFGGIFWLITFSLLPLLWRHWAMRRSGDPTGPHTRKLQ